MIGGRESVQPFPGSDPPVAVPGLPRDLLLDPAHIVTAAGLNQSKRWPLKQPSRP